MFLHLALAVAIATAGPVVNTSVASTYGIGDGFLWNRTACGGVLDLAHATVAHRSYRCGTRVTFWYGGRKVHAVVTDRGPYVRGRTWDLGPKVSRTLRFRGVGRVRWALGYW